MCKNILNRHSLSAPRAHHITKVLIKRGNGKDHDIILDDGEVAYNRTDKEFYVGDGNTPMRDLKSYNNIVEGDDGIIYLVRVDENGIPEAKEFVVNGKNDNKFKFKTKE